ncbi:cytochrome b561/ferric reductase transmembrane protein family [Actinidia rufa]|uniref:Cytochrome b561/ferric reductase transmembrane protein family n=1 Tax=Actinidia rufa TaxID=165716 RepID=A0A7J0DV32_9ERIC|nr:cytochrome b561/ferric reductase transmembrane protein family [Actinidia rufa]
MPKKHRAIAGVGPSSILELKAQLYRSQEESKRSKEQQPVSDHLEYQRAKKKIAPRDSLSLKNSGVDARALKDKLELKAVNDGSASYAALERKAGLYEKLARGELSDEEDKEKYCVDFFSKSLMKDESEQPQVRDPFCCRISRWEVHEEANQAREKVSELKLRRQVQAAARREKLKQAYLRKQLEKLKSDSKTEQT